MKLFTGLTFWCGLAVATLAYQEPLLQHDHTQLINLHRELVERPSVSGKEHDVGVYLYQYLQSLGYTVETQTVDHDKGRFNLYAYLGDERNTKTLLTSHIDTVPPYIPYNIKGDRIYGRGTVDAKNCVSAQIIALEELRKVGEVSEGDVGLLFVVDEEVHGEGMRHASKVTNVDTWENVIFGEPTELKLGVGHKGIAIANYKAHGKASHSGYPELGVNANTMMIKAMAGLIDDEWPYDDLLGPTTVNVGKIDGGVAANVVPADAEAVVAVRIAAEPQKVVDRLKKVTEDDDRIEMTNLYQVDPQHMTYDVEGFESVVLAYSTDVPNLQGNFTRYLYGAGSIHVAHGPDEYVTFSDLIQSVEGYKKLVQLGL